ncbi:MAG: patatin-like phospholipase family protein [Hyphomicrobiaceae bacterium]
MSASHATAGTLGLVLPGGGARGAYQVGALRAIAEIAPTGANPFPVITGASVGAINAVALATRARDFKASVDALGRFWKQLRTSDVYRTDLPSISLRGLHWVVSLTPLAALGIPNPQALLDNTPLRRLLAEQLDFGAIEGAIRAGDLRAVGVTASSYDRGRAVTFFQGARELEGWSRARRDGVPTPLTLEHVMAAAALPFVFPAQRIGREHFGDGSLRLTSPLSPAIHTGADRILVITARDGRPDPMPANGEVRYPSIGSIGGSLLDIIFMDNVDADIERARRIDHTLSLVPPERGGETQLRDIEVKVIEPSLDVRDVAREYASHLPWTIRMLLRRLGMWGRDWRLPSYLMFEPAYCGALMDLGYRDTMARAGEIAHFLGAPAPASGGGGVPSAV